jgi:hypothetical protein
MEYSQRVIIRFLCKERVPPADIHARLETQFGIATYSERNVRRSCQYVQQGREDLHREARSDSPLIDFLDIRILALLDEQFFHLPYSIAEALGVSYLTLVNHSRESLGMKIFHLHWIPHELTTSFRQIRMETCQGLLRILKAHETINFKDG